MSETETIKRPGPGRPPKPKSVVLTEKQAELIQIAKAAQEQRRAAPPISLNGERTVAQKVIIERLAEVDGGKGCKPDAKDGFHYAFFDAREADKYAYYGYEVALNALGKPETIQTDVCLKIPTDIWKKELEAVAARGMKTLNRSIRREIREVKSEGLLDKDGVQIRTEERSAEELDI